VGRHEEQEGFERFFRRQDPVEPSEAIPGLILFPLPGRALRQFFTFRSPSAAHLCMNEK
jgi:hypothetical protein